MSVATSMPSEEGLRMAVGHTVHNCMLFGKAASLPASRAFRRRAQVFILGELQHRKYERRVGNEEAEWPVTVSLSAH